jgi:hypothetical protein
MNNSHDHAPTGPARVILPERPNAGLQVTLLWAEDTNAVAIFVCYDGSDNQFEVSVEADYNALHAFEHPYAYAAWRGVDYRLANLRDAA